MTDNFSLISPIRSSIFNGWLALGLIFWLPAAIQAADIDDLLKPEQAFVLTVTPSDSKTLIAEWDIAEGYYLYRERFRFESATPGIQLGEPHFPAGQPKQDEFFGLMETYRQRVAITLPLLRDKAAPDDLQLTTIAQGCADIGVCFPPQTQQVAVNLPTTQISADLIEETPLVSAADTPPALSDASGASNALLFNPPQDELLQPEQAFVLSVIPSDPQTLIVRWHIVDDHYLYRDRLSIELLDADGIQIDTVDMPAGESKDDEFYGQQTVYYHEAELIAHLQRTDTTVRTIQVQVNYQGCSEKLGVCYPPQQQQIPVTLAATEATVSTENHPPDSMPEQPIAKQ